TAADAGIADDLAALDAGASDGGEGGEVRVPGGDAEAVVHDDNAAVAAAIADDGDDAVRGDVYRRSVIGSDVDAGVERAFPAKGIEPRAESVRDVSHDRADGRRVAGVGKAHGGHQAQVAGGTGDSGSVLLEER